jgi:hypothetical protein
LSSNFTRLVGWALAHADIFTSLLDPTLGPKLGKILIFQAWFLLTSEKIYPVRQTIDVLY